MTINFFSSKYSEEIHTINTKSDNMDNETNEIIEKLFKNLLQRYEERLEESMKGSEFIFDNVDLLYYNLNKISLNMGRSYIDYPEWLKSKKATINPKNNNDKCFQYFLTVALNHQSIEKSPQRISKIKPFIDQYNWKEINFTSHRKDWKKFKSNNKSIALNILYVTHNTEKIRLAYKSKYYLNRENRVILLMITDGQKWHYLAIKGLSAILKGITSNHKEDFYCSKCLH